MNETINKFYRVTTIENNEYQISLLPALEAMKMARTLSKVVLPLLGGTLDGIRDEGIYGTPRTFSELALVLCTQLDNIDLDDVITKLLRGSTCNGKEYDPNIHFRGDLGEMIQLLEFCLKENFSSFFSGKGLLARFQTVMNQMGQEEEISED